MTNFFKELFTYNHHYNQQLADIFIEKAGKTSEKSLAWFNHILNAHQLWNSRILSEQTAIRPWDLRSTAELKKIDSANYACSVKILDSIELHRPVHYTTSNGQGFTNTAKDILFHVVNHSTYHRGQIAADFRQQGIEPPATDYIFYKRQH